MLSSRRAQPGSIESIVSLFATTATVLALALPCPAQKRLKLPPGGSNWVPQTPLVGGLVTQDMGSGGQTAAGLVQALVGAGVTVTNIQYNGAPVAAGTFTGGTGIIGFAQGILLSSGNIGSVVGPQNVLPDTSTDNLMPGDPDLDALVGGLTQDATVLEFDFECPNTNVVSFQYVFASEEYDEWVNTQYNDVFAFFLNGQNIALIPSTTTPVAVNNVNCNNPYNPPTGQNCALYTTNACDSLGLGYPCTNIATEVDGMTLVFSSTGTLRVGPNHIKLAIADRGDGIYDSNVFIRGQSFVCAPVAPVFDPPSPCGQTLIAGVGVSLSFEVDALATNGLPGEAVTLDVTGDATPLAGGTFIPPLPAGPAESVSTEFHWTPGPSDAGLYHLHFTATDQIQQSATCDVDIRVTTPPGVDLCQPGTGSVRPCPCSNPPSGAPSGCDNSSGTGGALLQSMGDASLSSDSVVFVTSDEKPTALSIVVQGNTFLPNGLVYGQGVRCVGGTLKRLYMKSASGGAITAPGGGDPSVSGRSAALGDPIAAGSNRWYGVYYRDQTVLGSCPIRATFNITQTQQILWAP
jgi:hypothetical protein